MKSDGSIIIDTKILDDGMEKGFEQLQDEMASVGITARKVGEQIEMSFSNIDVSKPIANAANQIRALETQLATVTADLAEAVAADDNRAAERLANKQVAIYSRLEQARERLALEVVDAANKQATAEEKAAERAARAAEREAKARARAEEQEMRKATKSVRRFNNRLKEIAAGALVFNLISAGLRGVTEYFGDALMANDEFSKAVRRLQGSLKTALQPVLEAITPLLIRMVNGINLAVQAVGRLFAALSGKSYAEIQKNAAALDAETEALNSTGKAAKQAAKYLAGFDEINQATAITSESKTDDKSIFEEIQIPDKASAILDELAFHIKDIFFDWDNLTGEQIIKKLLTGLSTVVGGLIGFAVGGVRGALIGATIGLGLSFLLKDVSFDSIINGWNELKKQLKICWQATVDQTGKEFVEPTEKQTRSLTEFLFGESDSWYQRIIDNWDLTARTTENGYIVPSRRQFQDLSDWITDKMGNASERIIHNFDQAARTTETGYVLPTREQFRNLGSWISEKMTTAKNKVVEAFTSLPNWFRDKVTEPIISFFNNLIASVVNGFNRTAESVKNAITDLINLFNRVARNVTIGSSGYYDSGARYSAASYAVSSVPALAKGAVIPPNNKFLAVLGDQKSGTNIEAPLATIQEAVALVMEDMMQSNIAGHEATVALLQQILEAVLGIEIDGETISNAVNNYNRKMAIVRGG